MAGVCGEGSGRLGGMLLGGGQGSQRGPGSFANPTQAINPITWGVFLFLLTLTCTVTNTLNLTPNPKPRLTAGSKLEA